VVMGDHGVGHTAFKRINKFNDDKTEQVWELFREEFARASVAEDGETSWRCAAGIMSVDDINKQITEEDAARAVTNTKSAKSGHYIHGTGTHTHTGGAGNGPGTRGGGGGGNGRAARAEPDRRGRASRGAGGRGREGRR